jgi:hypothetical protein
MTVVVGGRCDVPLTLERLATLGYRHRGNLGIEDREAFDHHRTDLPQHNLYVCPEGTIGIVNHRQGLPERYVVVGALLIHRSVISEREPAARHPVDEPQCRQGQRQPGDQRSDT